MIAVTVQRQGGRLRAYLEQLSRAQRAIPRELAVGIRDDWRAGVPVATGALRASIYLEGQGELGYVAALGNALRLSPRAQVAPPPPRLEGPGEYLVGSAVGYAAYVEYGTSRTPARPALAPALGAAKRAAPRIGRQHLRVAA